MTSANPQDQARHRIASGVEKIRQASQRGATREEIEALFAEMERPQTFNTAIGNLLVKTKDALLLSSRDQDLSHLNLQQAQQHCDDFFKGQPYVRYWVVAQAFQQLGLGIVKAMQLLPAIGELDGDKRWMWVAIASEVAHGRGNALLGAGPAIAPETSFGRNGTVSPMTTTPLSSSQRRSPNKTASSTAVLPPSTEQRLTATHTLPPMAQYKAGVQQLCGDLIAQLEALDEEHGSSNAQLELLDQLTNKGLISGPYGAWEVDGDEYDNFEDLMGNNPEFFEDYLPILEEAVGYYLND